MITSDPSSLVTCVEETRQILRTEVNKWFERCSSIASITSVRRRTDAEQRAIDPYTYEPGHSESCARKTVLANLLLAEGCFDEAAHEIERVYSAVAGQPNLFIENKNRAVHDLEVIERRLQSARSRVRHSPD